MSSSYSAVAGDDEQPMGRFTSAFNAVMSADESLSQIPDSAILSPEVMPGSADPQEFVDQALDGLTEAAALIREGLNQQMQQVRLLEQHALQFTSKTNSPFSARLFEIVKQISLASSTILAPPFDALQNLKAASDDPRGRRSISWASSDWITKLANVNHVLDEINVALRVVHEDLTAAVMNEASVATSSSFGGDALSAYIGIDIRAAQESASLTAVPDNPLLRQTAAESTTTMETQSETASAAVVTDGASSDPESLSKQSAPIHAPVSIKPAKDTILRLAEDAHAKLSKIPNLKNPFALGMYRSGTSRSHGGDVTPAWWQAVLNARLENIPIDEMTQEQERIVLNAISARFPDVRKLIALFFSDTSLVLTDDQKKQLEACVIEFLATGSITSEIPQRFYPPPSPPSPSLDPPDSLPSGVSDGLPAKNLNRSNGSAKSKSRKGTAATIDASATNGKISSGKPSVHASAYDTTGSASINTSATPAHQLSSEALAARLRQLEDEHNLAQREEKHLEQLLKSVVARNLSYRDQIAYLLDVPGGESFPYRVFHTAPLSDVEMDSDDRDDVADDDSDIRMHEFGLTGDQGDPYDIV
eukprot:jgi/Hompol1/6992/HPOL_002399-RA